VNPDGAITTVAGTTGVFSFSGYGGPVTKARLDLPIAVAVNREGNLYISDENNYRICRVDRNGTITTFAGMIEGQGVNREKGPATKVWLNEPIGLFIDDDSGSPVCLEPHHDSQLVGWRGTHGRDHLQDCRLLLHGIARRTDLRWVLFGDPEKRFEI